MKIAFIAHAHARSGHKHVHMCVHECDMQIFLIMDELSSIPASAFALTAPVFWKLNKQQILFLICK